MSLREYLNMEPEKKERYVKFVLKAFETTNKAKLDLYNFNTTIKIGDKVSSIYTVRKAKSSEYTLVEECGTIVDMCQYEGLVNIKNEEGHVKIVKKDTVYPADFMDNDIEYPVEK